MLIIVSGSGMRVELSSSLPHAPGQPGDHHGCVPAHTPEHPGCDPVPAAELDRGYRRCGPGLPPGHDMLHYG